MKVFQIFNACSNGVLLLLFLKPSVVFTRLACAVSMLVCDTMCTVACLFLESKLRCGSGCGLRSQTLASYIDPFGKNYI